MPRRSYSGAISRTSVRGGYGVYYVSVRRRTARLAQYQFSNGHHGSTGHSLLLTKNYAVQALVCWFSQFHHRLLSPIPPVSNWTNKVGYIAPSYGVMPGLQNGEFCTPKELAAGLILASGYVGCRKVDACIRKSPK